MQEPAPGVVLGAYALVRHERSDGDEQHWLGRRSDSATAAVAVRLRRSTPTGAFGREVELQPWLQHEHILAPSEQIELGEWTAVVGEYRPGTSLAALAPALAELRTRDPAGALAVAVHVIESLARALAHAHVQLGAPGFPRGIVHGALMPAAVWLGRDGSVALTGFGAAQPEADPSRVLDRDLEPLRYAAPEQLASRTRAPAIDVYALGALLHELVEGTPLRGSSTDARAVYQALVAAEIPPVAAAWPPALASLRQALLAKTPLDRPRADAVAATLAGVPHDAGGRALAALVAPPK
ncbi:MAG: protein kinase, partial [Nannocystaceae bacterium]|nr:protein kinase [Nannocystaceae bacterium]